MACCMPLLSNRITAACLFEEGIARMARTANVPLVQAGTDRLHQHVVLAARGSQVPIVQ